MLHLLLPQNAYKVYSKTISYFKSGGGTPCLQNPVMQHNSKIQACKRLWISKLLENVQDIQEHIS